MKISIILGRSSKIGLGIAKAIFLATVIGGIVLGGLFNVTNCEVFAYALLIGMLIMIVYVLISPTKVMSEEQNVAGILEGIVVLIFSFLLAISSLIIIAIFIAYYDSNYAEGLGFAGIHIFILGAIFLGHFSALIYLLFSLKKNKDVIK